MNDSYMDYKVTSGIGVGAEIQLPTLSPAQSPQDSEDTRGGRKTRKKTIKNKTYKRSKKL